MKSSSAKDVLAEFFELEETASGYIATCPDCRVRLAVNVKRDVVVDEYVRLLVEHANEEQVTFASDQGIRDWLRSREAKTKSFLSTLETAVTQADRCEYKVLRHALFDLKAKCSAMSSAVSTNPPAKSDHSPASAKP